VSGPYEALVRPLLFRTYGGDPERVHEATLAAITRFGRWPLVMRAAAALWARHRTPTTVAGIRFPGLVGLAAGMDKDGVGVRTWGAFGFGHAEIGTVTAQAQPGNDRPRLFRLPASRALVNRLGFNNAGASALAATLDQAGVRRGNLAVGIPLGISIGKTKIVPLEQAAEDYLSSLAILAPYADYIAVNVSSPNTPGLRRLQDAATLRTLLTAMTRSTDVPIFVKLAPDLTWSALEEALAVCVEAGARGLIATNTTLSRAGLQVGDLTVSAEAGGLSGAPLAARTRQVVRFLAERSELPIIGVGGILSTDAGLALLDAGASLLQTYTGFVYGGPGLINALNRATATRQIWGDTPSKTPKM
jgi:dihydroorotate dehydrogenase